MSDDYRLGVSEFTTWPWPFERDVERYAAHGLDSIEICEFKLDASDYGVLGKIRQAGLASASVQAKVHSLFPDTMAHEPKDPKERVACIKRSIDAMSPYLDPDTPFIVITGVAPEVDVAMVRRFAVDALRELAQFASDRGMRVAFEALNPVTFNTDTAVWELAAGLEIVKEANHRALGLCVDTWNVFQNRDIETTIRECGDRIFLVQLSDWREPRRGGTDRLCLGDGAIAHDRLLRAIRSTGYRGDYVVEILSSESLPDSLWKSDLDAVLDRNERAFERLWRESEDVQGRVIRSSRRSE